MVGGVGALRAPKQAAPLSPSPQAAAAPVEPSQAAAEPALDELDEAAPTGGVGAGALAGAFSAAFGGGGDAAPEAEAPISMPGDEWFVGINGVPVGPIRLSELRSKAASGAVDKESLVWRDGFEDWRPLKTYPELVAVVEEGVSSARASLTPFTPPASEVREPAARMGGGVTSVAESASAVSTDGVAGTAVVADDLERLGVPQRRGTSPAVWVAMAIAILFGLTIGFVLFGGQKPTEKIVEKIVEVPAKGSEKGSVPAPAADNTLPESDVPGDPQAPKRLGGPSKPGSSSEADGKPGLNGLKGLTGLSGLGPSGGPNSGGPSTARPGGAQLESGQIQATVSRYTGSVKRRCWQPALDARAKDAPMTAKVTVTITVGGSGSVQSATTSGEPRGYSGLASCIAGSVRSWQFPASGGTTVANVPFVFAGQ